MYIAFELTDNIDIRKLIFWDVKVNPRMLAHHRGTRRGGGGLMEPLPWFVQALFRK